MLDEAGLTLNASEDDKYVMTIRVAEGKSSVEEIQAWIEARIRQV